MNTVNRRLHERALELAASAIDFALGSAEAAELGDHLAACSPCARSAAALRADAVAIRLPVLLPSRRVDDAVYAAIAGRDRRASSPRLLVLAAAALLLVALLGVAAAGAFLRIWPTLPTVVVDGTPGPSVLPAPSGPPALPADTLILAVAGDGETRVVLTVRPDGQDYQALASGDWAVWSPDGRSILYSCRSGETGPSGNVCVMNADGSGQRLVIADGIFPTWSPDGTQILFSRSAIDAGNTWVANADGTNARKVGDGAGSWAPDGEWILLLGASGAAPDATIVHPDGSGARDVGTCWNATWSPDGSRLACTSWDERRGTLTALDVDSGTTTTLLEADVAIGDPVWMDTRLAITMTRAGSSPSTLPPENDIFIFDVASGDLRQLTHGLSIEGPIDVSGWLAFTVAEGDGRDVYVVSEVGETHRVTSNGTTGQPRWQVITTSPGPAPTSPASSPRWTPAPGAFPVGATGAIAQVAPGPDGGAYVLVSAGGDAMAGRAGHAVLALLDASGDPRSGWPIAIDGWTCDNPNGSAWPPETASDGTATVVCRSDAGADGVHTTAFRFDATGGLVASWTDDGDVSGRPRVIDGRLLVIANEVAEKEVTLSGGQVETRYTATYWLEEVGTEFLLRSGARVDVGEAGWPVVLGPDGTAYHVDMAKGVITAFDLDGSLAGWPARLDGNLSALGFGSDGRVYVTVAPEAQGTSRLVVLARDGSSVARSDPLPLEGTIAYSGAGPDGRPMAPLVADDGAAFVIGEAGGHTVVYGIDPSGKVLAGWPYRADTAVQWQGSCPADVTGCGVWRAIPAVSADGVVYLPLAAPDAQIGGSIVAISRDGQALPGWPMHLARRGAEFWSVVPGSDGTVYALAIEPEPGGKTSATILAIAKDGTVLSRTTVVEP